jgi:nicotinamidase-related amidase
LNSRENKLLNLFRRLGSGEQDSLLDFAEFLSARRVDHTPTIMEPRDIPRPENESVVNAMKRLTKTYPMLETKDLFTQASSLMTQHVMRGREATEIIDELEQLFREHYKKIHNHNDSN